MTSVKNAYHFLFVLLLMLFCYQLPAQLSPQGTKFIGDEGTLRFFELRDSEGNLIKTASEMAPGGTPMLRPGWASGIIHYQNGQVFTNSSLNFSLYDDRLFYTAKNKLFAIVMPVESFFLSFQNADSTFITYNFKSRFPAINNHDTNSFYEVLFEGRNLQLLQWNHKKVRDVFTYGSSREKEFALEQQLYLYLPKEKLMKVVKPGIPAITKILPSYSHSIAAYCLANKLNMKDKEQLIGLISYLDASQ